MNRVLVLFSFLLATLAGCQADVRYIYEHDRVVSATDCDTVFVDPPMPDLGDTGSTSGGTTGGPTFTCPTITNGDVQFCADGYPCRTANFMNVNNASSTSRMLLYWHGTYEGNNNPLSNALPYGFLSAATSANALVVMPRADNEAVSRFNNPFPWWIVCGETNPAQCTRDDDFVLADMIATCAVAQGLADPDRLTVSGMSAGGIMTSHLIERGLEGGLRFAAAVSWSGGTPAAFQPTVPASPDTAVFVLHGGVNDVYCGVGNPAGSCNGYQPYSFVAPSETMASEIENAGNFAFICDHGSGHNAVMGQQGVEFLLVSDAGGNHPWQGFPFGVDGYDQWPQMSGGTNWMLRFYGDCRYPM